ncbi:MAG: immunoglobulin domain-containing protein [Verrucomicrobiae bacterium]|nr:immunoglobulin domain-containing protein [Verrucomicrobiae bacterium]
MVTIPAAPELNVRNLTIEGWINPDETITQQALFEFSSPYNYGLHIWINMNGSWDVPGMLYANLKNSYLIDRILTSPAGAIKSNQWSHIALTYEESSGIAKLYINGEVVNSSFIGTEPPRTSLPIYLGSRQGFYGFKGKMDEFALYNRALTDEEVRRIYLAGSLGKCPPEIPPSIAGTNQQVTVALRNPLRLTATVLGNRPMSFWWQLNGTNLTTEPTSAELFISAAALTDSGSYSLVASNAFGVTTALVAQVTVQPSPPTIAVQPRSSTVLVGQSVTLLLRASGSPPMAFQWYFNGAPLAGATRDMLTLSAVTLAQAGAYQVVVTNEFGAATSTVATLTVQLPPPKFIVSNALTMAGSILTVPIVLAANGTENAMQFSLTVSTSRLQLLRVEPGPSLTNATFLTNLSLLSQGRIGVAISLPSGATMPVGTQEIARLTFQSLPMAGSYTTPLSFSSSPLTQQVANAQAQVLQAEYVSGVINLMPTEYEADVAPRGAPDRLVTVVDWVQVGRFVAALDTPAAGAEFQRADCAPRSEGGNGLLTASDWVQAGRYAAGLDPLAIVSGPTNFAPPGLVRQALAGKNANGNACTVSVAETSLLLGKNVTVPVMLHANGTESALTFSLQFNPAQLTFVQAQAVSPAGTSAVLNQNPAQAAQGRVGMALSLQAGQTYPAGLHQVVLVSFAVRPDARGPVALSFASQPVAREVANLHAQPLTETTWAGRNLALALPTPQISTATEAGQLTFRWPAGLPGVYLEATDDLVNPQWMRVNLTPEEVDGQVRLNIPADAARKFYRLRTE